MPDIVVFTSPVTSILLSTYMPPINLSVFNHTIFMNLNRHFVPIGTFCAAKFRVQLIGHIIAKVFYFAAKPQQDNSENWNTMVTC